MLLLSHELIHSFSRAAADAQMAIWGYPSPPHALPPALTGVDVYRVVHRTPDRDGTLVSASGLVAVPTGVEGPRPLVSFQHGTATQRISAPSTFNYQVQTAVFGFATGGYVVSCTDYLGLGSSPVLHPYVIAAANGRVALDMIRATRELCDRLGLRLDSRLYVTGYSEGGHTAMAVARAAQADMERGSSEFAITAGAPLAGVYNLLVSATPELTANAPPGTGLLFVAYTLLAWQAYYGDLYRSLHDVFRFPFSAVVPRLFDGTLSFDRTREALYAAAVEQYRRDHPDKPGAQPLLTTFDVITPAFAAAFVDPTSPMGRRLRENSVHEWTPRMPLYLVGARNDSQVCPSPPRSMPYARCASAACSRQRSTFTIRGRSTTTSPRSRRRTRWHGCSSTVAGRRCRRIPTRRAKACRTVPKDEQTTIETIEEIDVIWLRGRSITLLHSGRSTWFRCGPRLRTDGF